ncbi:hypothetical protein DRH14_02330 [Candidatus Shapirobacteria bacterium]|nr:MAG: hypothetical protein DRH14_02330 [Candidatus Shapirobacteria bacterium]
MNKSPQKIIEFVGKIKVDKSWSFAELGRKDTTYITHGYHRYPAKFIPQIVSRLIKKYTQKGDLVVDPFGGCGTTIVEAKTAGRKSLAVDINPVAVLITKAKKTAIKPDQLERHFLQLKQKIENYNKNTKVKTPNHQRIDYWFEPEQKKKLSFLFSKISEIKNKDIQNFFFCAFSNILKNCSIWLQKSNKPTRDLKKIPSDPFKTFFRQTKAMMRGNKSFYFLLQERGFLETSCQVFCGDARDIPTKNNTVELVVTSPPYVTSYEYADLHQLTALWFKHTKNLSDFRKRFIGTSFHTNKTINLNSQIAKDIVAKLDQIHHKTSVGVATYFSEMNQVFQEMKRILKKGGKTAIVIGNTKLKSIKILNTEVFVEQLQNLGLKIRAIIKREIPSKNLPSIRDPKTGRFAKITDKKKVLAYPTEYILIFEKQL